jgi:mRNA interferase RelE/StbE
MIFKLAFYEAALKEWHKLDPHIKLQFQTKLKDRLSHPRLAFAKLAGHPNRYKIKLRSVGYRLVYEVIDNEVLVMVVAVGKRERNQVYLLAKNR